MKRSFRLAVVLIVAVAVVAVAYQIADAQKKPAFPTRPIELIVPYSPGGGSGVTAETMKKIVSDDKLSPQPLIITYKPGANGQVGWAYLAGRKGNGHTISTATTGFTFGFVLKQSQQKPEDFTPIANMLMDTQLVVTYTNSPFKTIRDVIEASKKAPNSVKISGTSAIGADSTVANMLEAAEGIKLNMIPFMSGGEATAAILGGHVDLAISNPNELFPQIEAGKLRPLAVFSNERLAALKEVPTMKELGYNMQFFTHRGILAPAGIPKHEEEWLIGLMKKISQSKGWAEYANKYMMTVQFTGGADYAKYLVEERGKIANILKSMGKIKD